MYNTTVLVISNISLKVWYRCAEPCEALYQEQWIDFFVIIKSLRQEIPSRQRVVNIKTNQQYMKI